MFWSWFFSTFRKVHGIEASFLLVICKQPFDVRPKWLYAAVQYISLLRPPVEGLNLSKILLVAYTHLNATVPASKSITTMTIIIRTKFSLGKQSAMVIRVIVKLLAVEM